MWIFILVILFVSIVFISLVYSYITNKNIVEQFEEMQKETMTRYQRSVEIIKAFETVTGKKPSPKELGAYYDEFSEKSKYTHQDVIPMVKDEAKYYAIMNNFFQTNVTESDVDEEQTAENQTIESNNIKDELDEASAGKLIDKSYTKIYPGERLAKENREFLIYKLKRLENDIEKLENYLTSDVEYKEFIKKRVNKEFKLNLSRDEKETHSKFKILRPDTNKTTLDVETSADFKEYKCQDLEDEHMLAKIVNDRNLDELRYACARSKEKYANVDENMVLLPDQRWSVPQKQPEVCRNGHTEYQPSVEQTALIGTLLESAADTKVGSILPDFDFQEK